MERNLLFVNKHPEIIQEFTKEMAEQNFKIDVADNGIDAALLLKKKEYQVVVTGLVLEGFNGEQIITYINKTYPDTVCIIYTTNISAAQLHFFINQRDVFRVFLRPVNFRNEFFEALSEAFEYNEVKKKDREEIEVRKKKLLANKDAIRDMESFLERQISGWGEFEQYLQKTVDYTIDEYAKDLEEDKVKKLKRDEKVLVKQCCESKTEGAINQVIEDVRLLFEKL